MAFNSAIFRNLGQTKAAYGPISSMKNRKVNPIHYSKIKGGSSRDRIENCYRKITEKVWRAM